MTATLGSLILFANDVAVTTAFYRAIGVPLSDEHHDDGPVHVAADIGGVHVAVFDASTEPGQAEPYRAAGSSYVGFAVADVAETIGVLRAANATVEQEPEPFPWGLRALVRDPDGRIVELFESSATVAP